MITLKSSLRRILISTLVLAGLVLVLAFFLVVRPKWPGDQPAIPTGVVDTAALRQHVIYLSEDVAPRDYTHPNNLNDAADYIFNELKKHSTDVSFQTYEVAGQTYKNIIARLGPQTGALLVVGAHYDVADTLPGADDNASGVAGLLELARLLGASDLKQPIELVAYTLEEPPFFAGKNMGSYVHAESIKNREVHLMIALEMIGYFTDEANSQNYPLGLMHGFYPDQGNFIAVVDQVFSNQGVQLKKAFKSHTDLPVYSINAPAAIPGVDFSDHRNYWHFGIPAIMVTDTAFYRNQNYHTAEDTHEKLDYEAMSKVVGGVYHHLLHLSSQ